MEDKRYSKEELEKLSFFEKRKLRRKYADEIGRKLDELQNSDISADEYKTNTASLQYLTTSYDTLSKPGKVFELVKLAFGAAVSGAVGIVGVKLVANTTEKALDNGTLTKSSEKAINQISGSVFKFK